MEKWAIQARAALLLRKKAESMGLKGFGGVLILPDSDTVFTPTFAIAGDMKRLPDPVNRGPEDTGTNYAAVGCSKLAEMIITSNNSGTTDGRLPMKGEFGYRGGAVHRSGDTRLFAFFSGGTAEEDLEVALEALASLVAGFVIKRKPVAMTTS